MHSVAMTTYNCEFDTCTCQGVLDSILCDLVCQSRVSEFLRLYRFPPQIKLTLLSNYTLYRC